MSIDLHSQTWIAVKAYADKQIDRLRLENDSASLGAERTQFLRGQIFALKALRNLVEEDDA